MKKLSRRQFLKAAGAAAGMAVLGQGCGSKSSGKSTPTPIPTPRPDYKLPACCSYDSDYNVEREPKRPQYGIVAKQLGETIDYIEEPENLPGEDPLVKRAVENCLGFSIDMLFEGDTHSARNGLAAVAEIITLYFGGYLSTYLPEDVSPDDAKNIKFFDSKKNIDLWDMITFPAGPGTEVPPSETGEKEKPQTGSAAVESFTKGRTDKLADWLRKLAQIADSLDLHEVFRQDFETTDTEYIQLLDSYGKTSPEDQNAEISQGVKDELGVGDVSGGTYDGVVGQLGVAYVFAKAQAEASIDNFDSLNCEKYIAMMYDINGKITALILRIMRNHDERVAEEAKNIKAREGVVHNAKHIWDPIKQCCEEATIGEFEKSLHAWRGAKKYIVAGGCALVEVPAIIATGAAALPGAVAGFIWCFLKGMIGSPYDVAWNITKCMIEKVF